MSAPSTRSALLSLLFLAGFLPLEIQVRSQVALQVGYAVLVPAPGVRAPVASALFSVRNLEGVLASEAGVAAVEPIRRGRVFVDQLASTRTGVAWANPFQEKVTLVLTLRTRDGTEVDHSEVILAAKEHVARYVDELFSNLSPDFSGSLTFEAEEQGGAVAAVTLRQTPSAHGEDLLATLPVADLDRATDDSAETVSLPLVFPHIGAGTAGSATLSTQFILINPAGQDMSGHLRLYTSQGGSLVGVLDGLESSVFEWRLAPHGSWRATLSGGGALLQGQGVVTVDSAGALPSGTAVFQFRDRSGALVSEAGVAAVAPTTRARVFVDTVSTQTGVAIAAGENEAADVDFELLDRNGFRLESANRSLPPAGQLALFADELFPDLPPGFTGLMEIRSPVPLFPVTLKFTVNGRKEPVLTTLPVADLAHPVEASLLVFPQIGFGPFAGGEFFTRLIFVNTDSFNQSSGALGFYASSGVPLAVDLPEGNKTETAYFLPEGGARQILPGNRAEAREILVATELNSSEIAVSEGSSVSIAPIVLDSEQRPRDDLPLTFTSVDPRIAEADRFGRITGRRAGFATLTVSSGGANPKAVTVSVTAVRSGASGLQITGLANDFAGRIYMADTGRHRLLLAQALDRTPETYAGIDNLAGWRDDLRSDSLFDGPAFLALNQATASLYVSDSNNHVIRRATAGPLGRVETLAGRAGMPGRQDGGLTEARFDSPQGVALDSKGGLWVADTGNHAIRRIDLVGGTVRTVAGLAGHAGSADGVGSEARFNSPVGIAVLPEPLADQLVRLQSGDPPPPVTVIVADTGNGALRRVREDGLVTTVGGAGPSSGSGRLIGGLLSADGAPLRFASPRAVAADPFGNVYFGESGTGSVRILLRNGQVVPGAERGTFSDPQGIAFSGGGRVVVADGSRAAREIRSAPPKIETVFPDRIRDQGEELVTIEGENFAPDSVVILAGRIVVATVVTTRRIVFTAPRAPSGLTTLTVEHRGGVAQRSILLEPIRLEELEPGGITTVAGGSSFVGDGGPAAAAALFNPGAVTVDAVGNLYIADSNGGRVRRVDPIGVITTVAGTGEFGFSGDGGPAAAANLAYPQGVAVDRAGNLYIADYFNDRVRRVDPSGLISTVAGNGDPGYSGDGGPAAVAALRGPLGVTVDEAGDLYIADTYNNRIRRVDPDGVITTVAGNGDNGFSGDGGPAAAATLAYPQGVTVDASGNLYIADTDNNRIRRVDPDGVVTTVAGNGETGFSGDGGLATDASLGLPTDVAVDASGDLYIVGSNLHVRRVDRSGVITTVAGNGGYLFSGDGGPAIEAAIDAHGAALDGAGNLYIADLGNNRIRRVDTDNVITTVAGTGQVLLGGDGGPAAAAALDFPQGLAVDEVGNLYIADTIGDRIRRVDPNGVISTVAGTGEYGFSGDGGLAAAAFLHSPAGVTLDGEGSLYIADEGNHRIRRVDPDGVISTVAGTGEDGFSGDGGPATDAALFNPEGVAVDATGNLYIADSFNHRIRRVDPDGVISTVAGNGDKGFSGDGGPATAASLSFPRDVAVDASGNLYIADTANNRVRRVDPDGVITTVAGTGEFGFSGDGGPAVDASLNVPAGITLDKSGNLYLTDFNNNRVRRVDPNGMITTVAGTGERGFSGDGGPAVTASLDLPGGVATDAAGNLYFIDAAFFNPRIRAIRGPLP